MTKKGTERERGEREEGDNVKEEREEGGEIHKGRGKERR